jgi:hypothetical protein
LCGINKTADSSCRDYNNGKIGDNSGGYGSYYVEGIGNLYEFDCGRQSGWVYTLNGASSNYGCSSYVLKDGEHIEWSYTCKGLGSDAT